MGKNEEMFLCLKGDVMSSQKALVNGNNKIKSPRLDDKISHENAKNKASLTAQELAECFQVQGNYNRYYCKQEISLLNQLSIRS